jgi:uncharacterized membrane protein
MIFLAGLIYHKLKHILMFSLVVIFGHNALDSIQIGNQIFWSIIDERNFIDLSNGIKLLEFIQFCHGLASCLLGIILAHFMTEISQLKKERKYS